MCKTLRYLCLFFIVSMLLTACDSEKDKTNSYQMQNLPDGNYILAGCEDILYPYGNRIYAADSENGSIGYYDPLADMAYTSLSAETAIAIYANDEGVFACTGERILWLDQAGIVLAEWPVEVPGYGKKELSDPQLCVSDTTALFVYNIWGEGLDIDTYFTVLDRSSRESAVYVHDRDEYMICGQYRITPEGENFLILANIKPTGAAFNDPALLRYSVDTGKTELLCGCENVSEMDLADGMTYGFDTGLSLYKLVENINDGEMKTVLRNFDEAAMAEAARIALGVPDAVVYKTITEMFYTGHDVLLWEPKLSLLTVADTASSAAETIYVLYPVTDMDEGISAQTGYVDYDIRNFEMTYDCSVQSTYYSVTEFSDRLRMKLLAGEDDMDVIYIDHCDEGDMLSAILRYGLYYPLENESAIIENFNQFADGIQEYMTYDGHLVGVPYSFTGSCYVITDQYIELCLPIPNIDWTLSDFWELCETAADMDAIDGNTVLAATNQCTWIFEAILENGYRTGKIDENAIREAVQNLKQYYDQGVLAPWLQAGTVLMDSRAKVPAIVANNTMYEKSGIAGILPVPTVNGNRYMPLESFMFIYSGTQNKDIAVAYMTMLTDEETTSRIDGNRSHFRKDTSEYYIPSLDFTGQTGFIKVKEMMSEEERYLLSCLSDILPGTQMQTTSYVENKEKLNMILDRLYADEITVNEAVEEIVTYGDYRYLE